MSGSFQIRGWFFGFSTQLRFKKYAYVNALTPVMQGRQKLLRMKVVFVGPVCVISRGRAKWVDA